MGSTALPTPQLLNLRQVCSSFAVSPSWVYKRTRESALDPLPVVRGIGRLKFDADRMRQYIEARQRPAIGATLSSSDGNAWVNGKGYRSLTRRRFQTGSVRLREDRTPSAIRRQLAAKRQPGIGAG